MDVDGMDQLLFVFCIRQILNTEWDDRLRQIFTRQESLALSGKKSLHKNFTTNSVAPEPEGSSAHSLQPANCTLQNKHYMPCHRTNCIIAEQTLKA
jgi:hypothetical protein